MNGPVAGTDVGGRCVDCVDEEGRALTKAGDVLRVELDLAERLRRRGNRRSKGNRITDGGRLSVNGDLPSQIDNAPDTSKLSAGAPAVKKSALSPAQARRQWSWPAVDSRRRDFFTIIE
jgi:hypothetical protein